MRLWRLTRDEHQALDGNGARTSGGRYSSPGHPLISFASEAGLAVLVTLRYWQTRRDDDAAYVLGWTETGEMPERVQQGLDDAAIRAIVDDWAGARRSLLIAVPSKVLPEADVVLMNAEHAAFATVPPLTVRPFSFEQCLHRPPMLERFSQK